MPERIRVRVRPWIDGNHRCRELAREQHAFDEHTRAAHLQLDVDAKLPPLARELLRQRDLYRVIAD